MNKLLYTFCFLLLFTSCSSDDEEGNSNDPIIGTWNLFSVNGNEVSDCEKQTTITFNTNNTTTSKTFQLANTDCISIDGTNTWQNKGDNLYNFNNLESRLEFSEENRVFTILSGNTVYKKQ